MPMIRESGKDSPGGRGRGTCRNVVRRRRNRATCGDEWHGLASGARRHEDVKGDCVNLLDNLVPYPRFTGVGEP